MKNFRRVKVEIPVRKTKPKKYARDEYDAEVIKNADYFTVICFGKKGPLIGSRERFEFPDLEAAAKKANKQLGLGDRVLVYAVVKLYMKETTVPETMWRK